MKDWVLFAWIVTWTSYSGKMVELPWTGWVNKGEEPRECQCVFTENFQEFSDLGPAVAFKTDLELSQKALNVKLREVAEKKGNP